MTGRIVQINISPGGLPKRPIPEGFLDFSGVTGDAWAHPTFHGGPQQAVLLIGAETVERLAGQGYPVFFGALGENITSRGVDCRQLRLGHHLRVGDALVELTKIRVPCATLDRYGPSIKEEIYDHRVEAGDCTSARWGMSGFYARVLQPGLVRVNDIITVERSPT